MANTYTTKITQMYTTNSPTPGYVVNVLFKVTGIDPTGKYTAFIDGNVSYINTPDQPDFIPYDQLTQEEVMGWINESTDNLTNYYANVDGQISSMANPPAPPAPQPLPWPTAN